MKILLEGPDGSGKTFLGKILCEAFKLDYLHYSYEEDYNTYKAQIKECFNLLNSNDNILLDRFIPSELVYGKHMRVSSRLSLYESPFGEYSVPAADIMLMTFDKIIFCLPNDKNLYLKQYEELIKERDEYVKHIKTIAKIYDEYQNIYVSLKQYNPKKYNNKIVKYDFFNSKNYGTINI